MCLVQYLLKCESHYILWARQLTHDFVSMSIRRLTLVTSCNVLWTFKRPRVSTVKDGIPCQVKCIIYYKSSSKNVYLSKRVWAIWRVSYHIKLRSQSTFALSVSMGLCFSYCHEDVLVFSVIVAPLYNKVTLLIIPTILCNNDWHTLYWITCPTL